MAIDFTGQPTTGSNFSTGVLQVYNSDLIALARMLDRSLEVVTAPPVGAFSMNGGANPVLERWDGTSWVQAKLGGLLSFSGGVALFDELAQLQYRIGGATGIAIKVGAATGGWARGLSALNAAATVTAGAGYLGNNEAVTSWNVGAGVNWFSSGALLSVVMASGNVGIGTTAPGAKLHVAAGELLLDNGFFTRGKTVAGSQTRLMGLGTSDIFYVGGIDLAVNRFILANTGAGTAGIIAEFSGGRWGFFGPPEAQSGGNAALQVGQYALAGSGMLIKSSTTGDLQFGRGTTGILSFAGMLRYDHASDTMSLWTAGASRLTLTGTASLSIAQIFNATQTVMRVTAGSNIVDINALAAYGELRTAGAVPLRLATNNTAAIVIDTSQRVTMPLQPRFAAYHASVAIPGAYAAVAMTELLDAVGNFDPATARFTAPAAGDYWFTYTGEATFSGVVNELASGQFYVNGVAITNRARFGVGPAGTSMTGKAAVAASLFVTLAAGDNVDFKLGGSTTVTISGDLTGRLAA